MENAKQLEDFSLDNIAETAKKQSSSIQFTGIIFAGTALASTIIFGLQWFASGATHTLSDSIVMVAIPVILAIGAFFYLGAARSSAEESWTLSARLTKEIEKAEKQLRLCKLVPVIFVYPMGIVLLIGTLTNYFDPARGTSSIISLLVTLVVGIALFAFTTWGIKREEKNKVSPLLLKLRQLQSQLNE